MAIPLLGLVTGCDIAPKYEPPLRIAMAPWPGYTPLYLARARRLFGETEVKIASFSTDFDAFRAVSDSRADVLCGSMFDILRVLDGGVDIKIIHILDFSKGADGVVARAGIEKVEDLRGKRVAVEVGTLTHFVLIRALRRAGVRDGEVTIVNLAMEPAASALERGEIDAAGFWEPFLTKASRGGAARTIFSSAEIPGEILDVLAVRGEVLERRLEDIERVLSGFSGALGLIEREPTAALPLMAEHMEVTEQELKETLGTIELVDIEQGLRLFDRGGGEQSAFHAYAKAAEFMRENKLLKGPPRDPEGVFDPALLRRVAARRR